MKVLCVASTVPRCYLWGQGPQQNKISSRFFCLLMTHKPVEKDFACHQRCNPSGDQQPRQPCFSITTSSLVPVITDKYQMVGVEHPVPFATGAFMVTLYFQIPGKCGHHMAELLVQT